MDIGVLLGKKLDSLEDQIKILSHQLKLQQPFIHFLENKFEGEFEEFMSNAERFEGTDSSIISYERPSIDSRAKGNPSMAKTVDAEQLRMNAGTQSSKMNNSVVFVVDLAESVSSDRPVTLLSNQLSSSISTTIFTECTGDPVAFAEVDTSVRQKTVGEVSVEGTEEFVDGMGLPSKETKETGPSGSGSSNFRGSVILKGSNVPFGGMSRYTTQSPYASSNGGLSRPPKRKQNENEWEKKTHEGSILSKLRKRFPIAPHVKGSGIEYDHKRQTVNSSDDISEEEDESDRHWSASGRTSVSSSSSKDSLESVKEDNWKCPICKKSFSTKRTLKTHKVTHSTEKEFKCLLCPKSFHTKGQLKSHQITHTNRKDFKCHFCAKFFRRGTSLRVHIRSKHSAEYSRFN